MTSPAGISPPADLRALPAATTAVLAALVGLIAAFTIFLWPEWSQNPDLSHGFLVPAIFLLLIWESRKNGPRRWLTGGRGTVLAQVAAMAGGFLLFALAGLLAASVAWTHAVVSFLLAASLCSFLLGGLLLLADARVCVVPFNWVSLTAIFLWLLVAPLPTGTYARITFALQGWVTSGVLHSLHLLGVPARQHGNIIELATTTVGVEEACSGIRSLISCVFAGFFFAAWQVRRPAARLALIIVAPVLALGMNFLRSLILTLLANSGRNIAGAWHDVTGFAILGLTAAILAWLAVLLETNQPAAVVPGTGIAPGFPRVSLRVFWGGMATTLALGGFYFASYQPAALTGRPAPDLAAMLPAEPAGWEVSTPTNLYQFAGILQTTHLMERTYVRADTKGRLTQLTVYVAYWPAGQTTVSRVASHTPDACWPGTGWIARPIPDVRQLLELPGRSLPLAEHRVFQNDAGLPQNVWFWHLYDGRSITYLDPYSVPALLKLALRYGFRRQGDQFFIRVSSNKPWTELAAEPLVGDIFTNLSQRGL